MSYQQPGSTLAGYQGQFGVLPALIPFIPGAIAAGYGIYKLIKPTEQETGTKYIPSGRNLKTRTRMPPDGRMSWITPEEMDSIVITIVDGAETVLRKIQVFSVAQLRRTPVGAAVNVVAWDKFFVGWKGSGKGKRFKADPSKADYWYYVDGEIKPEPVAEYQTEKLKNDTEKAADITKTAAEQGQLELATQYKKLAQELASQTVTAAEQAGTDKAKQAAEIAMLAAQKAQAALDEVLAMMKGDNGGMPSWLWLAAAGGAVVLLFMLKK